ncbi:MAG: GNAT family N-acetyltransferase [Streptosporangiaceae bacterium]
MSMLLPRLDGRHVRLEPLQFEHGPGLASAAGGDQGLYRWTAVPAGEAGAARYIRLALDQRDAGTAAPFAIVRTSDGAVIGSTRLWDLSWWDWPPGHPRHGQTWPDACEIGHTWLARQAIRTGANTEAKQLLLGHAFEFWQVHRVCFHTDTRNERSRRALERIGAQFEGILRAHRLAADCTPRDSARYSITAPQWPQARGRLAAMLAARDEGGEQASAPSRAGGPADCLGAPSQPT